jgi:hypothetical protein
MNKTGRESLMRRIKLFETKNCSKDVAQAAKRPIEDYSMLQIRDVSAGAAAFFGWVRDFYFMIMFFNVFNFHLPMSGKMLHKNVQQLCLLYTSIQN